MARAASLWADAEEDEEDDEKAAGLWGGGSSGSGGGGGTSKGGGRWTPSVVTVLGPSAATTAGAARATPATPVVVDPDDAGENREDDVLGLAYDEDLSENAFLRTLQTKHARLWAQATEQLCTVCVPCAPSLDGLAMTIDELEAHLLVRPKGGGGAASDEYRTLNNKMVRLERAHVKTLAAFRAPRRLRILFEETYYNAQNQSYRVLCIEGPLEGGVTISSAAHAAFGSVAVQLRTVADCRAYLWADTAAMDGRQAVDDAIRAGRPALGDVATPTLPDLTAAVTALYDRTLPILLKGLPPRASREPALKFVRLAYETHMIASLHESVFGRICALCASDDSSFNKVRLKEREERAWGRGWGWGWGGGGGYSGPARPFQILPFRSLSDSFQSD